MSEIKHNIDYEKRFIELLGYSLVGPNGSNCWIILDENKKQVGYIQYKKMYNGNLKKGDSEIFGYYTFIDSSIIRYEYPRKLNDKEGNIIDSNDTDYFFGIKRDYPEYDYVTMNIGEFPSLTVDSKKYGNIDFKVDRHGLYLKFNSLTEKFNIEEKLVYQNIGDEYHHYKEYDYQIRNCKKGIELDNIKGSISRKIRGTNWGNEEDQVMVQEITWVYGNIRKFKVYVVQGTVEEMATKNKMGIDFFNHFRFLINKIIPFKEEIISLMINENMAEQYNLLMFLPEYNKEKGRARQK